MCKLTKNLPIRGGGGVGFSGFRGGFDIMSCTSNLKYN